MVGKSCPRLAPLLFGAAACSSLLFAASPPDSALKAFDAHIRATEARLEVLLRQKQSFLWADNAERQAKLRIAGVMCQPRIGKGELTAPHALIHHWVGAAFIPGTTVERVLAVVQNYDKHKETYRPNVIDSKTLERRGNDFRVRLRLLERKLSVTVVLDTDYEIHYVPLEGGDCSSRSYSTRIVEIANAGTSREREKTAREDRGYLWRLYTYWLFRQTDGGTIVECEAVSLSRDIPGPNFIGPIGRTIIRGLPRAFLTNTLTTTRELARAK